MADNRQVLKELIESMVQSEGAKLSKDMLVRAARKSAIRPNDVFVILGELEDEGLLRVFDDEIEVLVSADDTISSRSAAVQASEKPHDYEDDTVPSAKAMPNEFKAPSEAPRFKSDEDIDYASFGDAPVLSLEESLKRLNNSASPAPQANDTQKNYDISHPAPSKSNPKAKEDLPMSGQETILSPSGKPITEPSRPSAGAFSFIKKSPQPEETQPEPKIDFVPSVKTHTPPILDKLQEPEDDEAENQAAQPPTMPKPFNFDTPSKPAQPKPGAGNFFDKVTKNPAKKDERDLFDILDDSRQTFSSGKRISQNSGHKSNQGTALPKAIN